MVLGILVVYFMSQLKIRLLAVFTILAKKVKQVNQFLPKYKMIRGIIITEEPLIKTSTNKIKRQENINAIQSYSN